MSSEFHLTQMMIGAWEVFFCEVIRSDIDPRCITIIVCCILRALVFLIRILIRQFAGKSCSRLIYYITKYTALFVQGQTLRIYQDNRFSLQQLKYFLEKVFFFSQSLLMDSYSENKYLKQNFIIFEGQCNYAQSLLLRLIDGFRV